MLTAFITLLLFEFHRRHLIDVHEAVARSHSRRMFAKNFSSIPQADGCKSPMCYSISHMSNPKYNYNAFSFNDALRHAECRRVFNVDGLCPLAARSVHRSPDDIVGLRKLAEGGFNRTFLITMRDGFQMVARIPYPATIPKYFVLASEVATMSFLRSAGLPIPSIYGYSPTPDNAAETEYIFMEFAQGTKLSDVWLDLEEQETISVLR